MIRFDTRQFWDIENTGAHPKEVMILANEIHTPVCERYYSFWSGRRYMFNNPKDIVHYAEIYAKYPKQAEKYLNEMRKDIDKLYKTENDGYTLQLLYDEFREKMDKLDEACLSS